MVNPITRSFAARKDLRALQHQPASDLDANEVVKGKGKKKDDPFAKFRSTVEISAVGLNLLRTLHKQVLPFILRRSKEMVARDLPSKTVVDVLCPLSSDQKQLYHAHLEKLHTSDALLEAEYVATKEKGFAADDPDELHLAAGELAQKSSLPQSTEDALVSDGWGNAGGTMSLPSFDEDDKQSEPAHKPKLNALEALNYLKLLCLHPALVVDASHSRFRARLLESPASSGKLVRLAVLLMDSGVIAREEFNASHSLEALLQLDGELVEKEKVHVLANPGDDSDQSDDGCGEEVVEHVEAERGVEKTDEGKIPADSTPSVKRSFSNAAAHIGASMEEELSIPLHRCLIFAQHRAALDLVEEHVLRRYFPTVGYERMDGGMEPLKRSAVARRFNDQPRRGIKEAYAFQRDGDSSQQAALLMCALPAAARGDPPNAAKKEPAEDIRILLMTTRSCGLGLNLTAADTVIFLEHDWNPFADLQAMDRVHRIGQTQPVTIYRLLGTSFRCSFVLHTHILSLFIQRSQQWKLG